MVSKYFDWVNEGQYVNARFASELGGDRVYGSGKVIAYTDQPTLTVLRADGARFSWIANLCEAAEEPTTEQDGAPSASAGGAPASKLCFAPVGQNGRGLAIRCDLPWGHPGAHHGVAGIDYGLTVRTAIPEPFRRMFWVAAEDLANVIGCTVVEGEPRGYGEPDPRDAEIERLRVQFDGIRGALRAANILIEGTRSERDQARAEVEELETQRDDQAVGIEHWRGLAEAVGAQRDEHARSIRELIAERDRKRRELADVTAERDRLRQDLDWIAAQPQGSNPYWQLRSKRVEDERDRLRQELDWIAAQPQGSNPYWQLRSKRVEDERDRLRQELDLIHEQHAAGLVTLRTDFTAAVNGLLPKPAEPNRQGCPCKSQCDYLDGEGRCSDSCNCAAGRRWVAGDPEPEIGTTVRSWQDGSIMVRRADGWHYEDCGDNCDSPDDLKWTEMLDGTRLVEVVSTDD